MVNVGGLKFGGFRPQIAQPKLLFAEGKKDDRLELEHGNLPMASNLSMPQARLPRMGERARNYLKVCVTTLQSPPSQTR